MAVNYEFSLYYVLKKTKICVILEKKEKLAVNWSPSLKYESAQYLNIFWDTKSNYFVLKTTYQDNISRQKLYKTWIFNLNLIQKQISDKENMLIISAYLQRILLHSPLELRMFSCGQKIRYDLIHRWYRQVLHHGNTLIVHPWMPEYLSLWSQLLSLLLSRIRIVNDGNS